eukprot:TRINITY_DN10384_c0_g1_i1.p1 TRINITY_DN10384_c0_g1~~TRINITY_DN10384_c0_g1_i1.p1  ORF type:complete len:425 (-),score=159.65 TRINITY_DN10384_c0_g1_i1:212-1390(-)
MDTSRDLAPTFYDRVFLSETRTPIYRLAFPSSSSSNLQNTIKAGATQKSSRRIMDCLRPALVGCMNETVVRVDATPQLFAEGGDGDGSDGVAVVSARRTQEAAEASMVVQMGPLWVAESHQGGQHSGAAVKEQAVLSVVDCGAAPNHNVRTDVLLRTVMLREPGQYVHRMFGSRVKATRADVRKLGFFPRSASYLFFDQGFEYATNCSLDYATLEQYVDLAHWRWNVWTRGLTEDYVSGLFFHSKCSTGISREEAWRKNNAGADSELFQRAVQKLHQFDFFGIFDRLEESMELLAFERCWNFNDLNVEFKLSENGLAHGDEEWHKARGAHALGREGWALFAERNRLDVLLFEYAEKVFDHRVAEMRAAQARGYRCRVHDSTCGIVCLDHRWQ